MTHTLTIWIQNRDETKKFTGKLNFVLFPEKLSFYLHGIFGAKTKSRFWYSTQMSISPQQEYRICTAWKPLHIYSQVWLRGRQCGCSAVPVTGLYWLCYVIRACWQQAYSQSAPSYQNTDIYCIAIGKYIYSQVWLRGRQWGQGCIPVTGLYWLYYVIGPVGSRPIVSPHTQLPNTDINCSTW